MVRCATVLFVFGRFSQIFGENVRFVRFTPPPLLEHLFQSCLKRGSGISVRLWDFAGFLTRNCLLFAYFSATESKRKLFERAGLPACARRYGWHDGGSIAQMVESGKFGWALSESGFSCLAAAKCPNCWNQRRPNLWIDRMADDGPIPIRWVSSRRLKRHIAVAK